MDYDKLAQKARQDSFVPDSTTEPKPPVKDWVDVPPGYTLDHQTSVPRVEAIHNREFLIALGTMGFVLWFLARFVRYGFAFGFKSTEPSPRPPTA